MKTFKRYLLPVALACSLALAPAAFSQGGKGNTTDNASRPIRGIDVVVLKKPGNSTSRMTLQPTGDGNYSVNLPGAGDYTLMYADGPMKGQTITKINATKPGPAPVNGAVIRSRSNVKNN